MVLSLMIEDFATRRNHVKLLQCRYTTPVWSERSSFPGFVGAFYRRSFDALVGSPDRGCNGSSGDLVGSDRTPYYWINSRTRSRQLWPFLKVSEPRVAD